MQQIMKMKRFNFFDCGCFFKFLLQLVPLTGHSSSKSFGGKALVLRDTGLLPVVLALFFGAAIVVSTVPSDLYDITPGMIWFPAMLFLVVDLMVAASFLMPRLNIPSKMRKALSVLAQTTLTAPLVAIAMTFCHVENGAISAAIACKN